MKAKMVLTTNNSRKEFIKEFRDLEHFNNYKQSRLEDKVRSIKYSLLHDNSKMYTHSVTEYGVDRGLSSNNTKKDTRTENLIQRTSRQNQLALLGNNLVNLNITPSIIKRLKKFMDNKPVTLKESKTIKSMLIQDKFTIAQYNLLKDIEERVNRRVPLINN